MGQSVGAGHFSRRLLRETKESPQNAALVQVSSQLFPHFLGSRNPLDDAPIALVAHRITPAPIKTRQTH
jgi:hypothetical protein